MFRFKNHPEGLPFLHDKLFTLEWELDNCKWILIHYRNGQRKKWYRSTERPYRFKRWFTGKAKGEFSNLANYASPKLEIYLFRRYISWPKKVVVPMQVNRLTTIPPEVAVIPFENIPVSPYATIEKPAIHISPVKVVIKKMAVSPAIGMKIQPTPIDYTTPVCDWPIAYWIENGLVTEKNIDTNYLQQLSKSTNHA